MDQSAGMLDDSAKQKGYALMCVAEPLTACRIRVIDEVTTSPYCIGAKYCCPLQHCCSKRSVMTQR